LEAEIRQFVTSAGPHAPEVYWRVAGVPLGDFYLYSPTAWGTGKEEQFMESLEEDVIAQIAGDPLIKPKRPPRPGPRPRPRTATTLGEVASYLQAAIETD
jgi:hypothetical protein